MRRPSPRPRPSPPRARPGRYRSAPAVHRCVGTMPADRGRPLVLEVARIGLEVRAADPGLRLVAEPAHMPFLTEATVEDCATVTLGPASGRQARRTSGKRRFATGPVGR